MKNLEECFKNVCMVQELLLRCKSFGSRMEPNSAYVPIRVSDLCDAIQMLGHIRDDLKEEVKTR